MNKTQFLCISFLFIWLAVPSCSSRSKKISQQENKIFKENLVKANKGLVEIDQERIDAFAKRHQWNMQVTQTGLWYQIIDSTQNEKASTGKVAHLKYQVSLLDGTLCYTSDSLGIMRFRIGQGGVESGLEQAILLMKIGEKGRFILPPHMAHGLLGDDNKIPPRSIIVYNAELLNLTDN
ncbi:MAG TPA: peptidylprolyl isomerase [Marinilabiliales bacterium]|jgi:FKBP-type peptidyl-prolyl cis-trans isomerase|nr:MAG: hypothetical protein A2W95_11965 [Bacteroidetes bacterium GWA2_40_14]OFX60272.1 MAG: hypothetical protein A2W84_05700 [Bacteroidetes bacterium GWC2_40_13]OFX74179.1 MAG: hypothetical protein A2W96_12815 [Bacteroidetes bacterium GWD2_40_43]OFX92987.1 MAG: hypothetical protein A2W97_05260 [Bacteroidetes bacterium GWE2_40_63]OFY21356.1 MAG: hypothetical protein A2W88_09255 [Bacteroidetes bacterium GWF2_40_13]OFZ30984.1 MAG: hypothetical protein A2437_15270 [Bacteroidetes bacterium RIFOXYC